MNKSNSTANSTANGKATGEDVSKAWLIEQFHAKYGPSDEPLHHFYAPGRVNLIGEYTDFNGGLVLPCGIDRGIHLLVRLMPGNQAKFVSANLAHTACIDIADQYECKENYWTNYPLGVFQEFNKSGYQLQGMQLYYYGDVPDGAGLSSSAAMEVVTAYALNTLYSLQISRPELALLSQRAENNFIGVQCGIMDQFAVAMAEANRAIALSCNTLEFEQVPLTLGDNRLLISNTGQRRELAGGAYNDRVNECNRALELLHPALQAKQLADVSPQALLEHIDLLTDPLIRKRATHVIEEHDRVKLATVCLKKNDLAGFGRLMVQSHQSLRDNFSVSSQPLDTMVELAMATDGVLGSRMTGAGFGGCTVTLIHRDAIDDMIQSITPLYKEVTQLEPEFYATGAAAGVSELAT